MGVLDWRKKCKQCSEVMRQNYDSNGSQEVYQLKRNATDKIHCFILNVVVSFGSII